MAADRQAGGVIFDVDGTLLDTNYLHVVAWWEAFTERGFQIRSADIQHAIGKASHDLVTDVIGRPDEAVIEAHSRHFAPYLGRMRPLPKAPDLVEATARLGLRVIVATSAKAEEVDLMLDALGARSAIDTVISSGDVERAKPEPDIVETALTRSGVDPNRCVMVGDTVWDVAAAKGAGVPCIGVLTGGIAEQELRAAGAVAVYPDASALLDDLEGSPIGELSRR